MTNFFNLKSNLISKVGELVSVSQLFDDSANLFKHIPSRSFVLHSCQNNIESVSFYVNCIQRKVVPLLIENAVNTNILFSIVNLYTPDFLFLPSDIEVNYKNYIKCYVFGKYTLYESALKQKYGELYPDLALLLTTSGTTGSPKFVRLSYDNIISNAKSIIEYLDINPDERAITSLPMSYSFGLSIINSHLMSGASVILTNDSIIQRSFWETISSLGVTSLSGVPYTYEMLKKIKFFGKDYPSIRTLTQAGGRLSPDLVMEFAKYCEETNKRFFVMYGQTEATARMSYLPCDLALSKCGSIGKAIPRGRFSIVSDNGSELIESQTSGELVFYGPNVSLGYANSRSDLEKGDENFGKLFTGDIAYMDDDGCYYIVGRKKRFIKIFGNRINLDELEQILLKVCDEVACTGIDDQLMVYLTDEDKQNAVRTMIAKEIGLNPVAFKIYSIDKIPKNSSGKTQYAALGL